MLPTSLRHLAVVGLVLGSVAPVPAQEAKALPFRELECHRFGISWGKGDFSPQDPRSPRAQIFRNAGELARYLGLKEPRQIPVAIDWDRQTLVLFRWTASGGECLQGEVHEGAVWFVHEPDEGGKCGGDWHTCVHLFAVDANVPWTWFTRSRAKDEGVGRAPKAKPGG